jgi:hypothetical protein
VIFGVKNVLNYVLVAVPKKNALAALPVPNCKMGYVHLAVNTKCRKSRLQMVELSVGLKVSSWVILEK